MTGGPDAAAPELSARAARFRLLVFVLAVVGLAAMASGLGPDVSTIRSWTDGAGWTAPALFVLLYAGLTVALVPGSVLTLAAGLLFGAGLGEPGLLAVVTLRLVPLVPFAISNDAAGITAVRARDFVVGTAVGIVPGAVAYTVLGANVADPTDPAFIAAIAALVVLAVAGTLVLGGPVTGTSAG